MDYGNDRSEWKYNEEDIAKKFEFFNVLKDGRVHVLHHIGPNSTKIPPVDDNATGVQIKDVKISADVAVRMFLPPLRTPSSKLPVLLYFHGGAFCKNSAFDARYTRLLTNYAALCNVLAVSVEYRLFPKHFISVSYDDGWTALHWIASHGDPQSDLCKSGSCDPWISSYADLKRIFIGGNSAGATISHIALANVRKLGVPGDARIEGMILAHPYFAEGHEMWMHMCPINEGPQDPRMKPSIQDLATLSCDRVLVIIGEKDVIRDGGVKYVEALKNSGWQGKLEFMENKDREHCFYVSDHLDPEAILIDQRIKSFICDGKVEDQ